MRVLAGKRAGARALPRLAVVQQACFLLLVGLSIGLLTINLSTYPYPWFDEGLNISTSATLARTGFYGLPDSDGVRILDAAIQVGPTLIVPVALSFKIFGIGLLQARMAIVCFALAAVIVFFLLSRRLFDFNSALLALIFLLVGSTNLDASFLYMSRQMLGEVPALAYYALGALILLRVIDEERVTWPPLFLAGLSWGVAMVTKSQMMLLLPVAVGSVFLLDRLYYRQLRLRTLIAPIVVASACVGAWYLAQIAIAGPALFRHNAEVLRQGGVLHILGFNLAHVRNALSILYTHGFLIWGLPGLIWGVWLSRHRTRASIRHMFLIALPIVWLVWFVGFSIGWARYAFYPFVLAPIWTANLIITIVSTAPRQWRHALSVMASLSLVMFFLWNGRHFLNGMFGPQQTDYDDMRAYLATQVPADALIESWEWEISLDARQPIHHPDTPVTNEFTKYIQEHLPIPAGAYDSSRVRPAYVLEGPFSRWTTIYQELIAERGELVAERGKYALYRVIWDPISAR